MFFGPVFSLQTNAVSVNEDDSTILVTINRTGDTSITATVDLLTQDGTAVDGIDYIGTTRLFRFLYFLFDK